jgi:2-keto-4-pentenoate hydratase/2-oxohepta-3-ene-1,7-dioic acid hydratase in catechol pathway
MRLTTYRNGGGAAIGAVLDDGSILDLALAPDTLTGVLRAGPEALDRVRAVVDAAQDQTGLPADSLHYDPPWTPGTIYAIGLNYRSHAEEQGAKVPANPIVFTKAVSSLTGHGSPIVSPAATERLDYEAELAVVIGRAARNVERADAMDYVAGYTCVNDVSARDVQRADRQWFRAKSYPTFCPLGRDFVTADEVPDVTDVVVSCRVGDEQRQSAPISDLIFDIPELIVFLSSFVTLEPGDVIATGTPDGVGFAMDPPRYLQKGDVVTVAAGGITSLRNEVTA